jgi:hypothetical protein
VSVHEEKQNRPDHGRDDASALTGPVESNRPAQESGNECPTHTKQRRDEEPPCISSRHDQLREGADQRALDASEDGVAAAAERLFFILNADSKSTWVNLPSLGTRLAWHRAIDTSLPAGDDFAVAGREVRVDPGDHYIANPRSTVVLLARKPG